MLHIMTPSSSAGYPIRATVARLMWAKFIEAVMQLRLRSLKRVMFHHDLPIRNAMRWYYRIGRRVWPFEIWSFLFREQRQKNGSTLGAFWGMLKEGEEKAMASQAKRRLIEQKG